mgnify:CR=1 FL=1
MSNKSSSGFIYSIWLSELSLSGISLKKKSTGKDLWIQWQNTVGNVLIDNLKPDAFERFLKAFCNIIKIVEHTAHFLAKRSSDGSPGNEVCTLCQKYGTNNGYYGKRERNPL